MSFHPAPKLIKKPKKSPKNIPASLRRAIYERDRETCQMCGEKGTSIHHIVSAGMGRRKVHQKENLILLCTPCHHEVHSGKNSEELQEWAEGWSRRRYGNVIDLLKRELRK